MTARARACVLRVKRWVYGTCAADGCESASEQMCDYCWTHLLERTREDARARAAAQFERDVRVHAEALRRVLKEGLR